MVAAQRIQHIIKIIVRLRVPSGGAQSQDQRRLLRCHQGRLLRLIGPAIRPPQHGGLQNEQKQQDRQRGGLQPAHRLRQALADGERHRLGPRPEVFKKLPEIRPTELGGRPTVRDQPLQGQALGVQAHATTRWFLNPSNPRLTLSPANTTPQSCTARA